MPWKNTCWTSRGILNTALRPPARSMPRSVRAALMRSENINTPDGRSRELDGLRGIAIVLVMALHIFNRANEFTEHPTLLFISDLTVIGWVGVDLFFVLSGFLITSILLKAREKDDYFKTFYARRA